ncbi:hypothetical protein E4P39_07540 [Blastococcus sp. CT_GayMR19]|nr:hypothetical protein E4P39_07540 [Blastococcus sp. CT_GayMR19]
MPSVSEDGAVPHPLGRQDAAALIGVLAVLEGQLIAGDLDRHVIDHLNGHLRGADLVGPGAGPAELRVALATLNQRLRYVLGEYAEPPAPDTGEVDQYFGFAAEAPARAFVEAVRARGGTPAAPVPVDGRAYDDGTVRWQVAVRTADLPLSAAFAVDQQQLLALAAQHGGSHGGWGSPPP